MKKKEAKMTFKVEEKKKLGGKLTGRWSRMKKHCMLSETEPIQSENLKDMNFSEGITEGFPLSFLTKK